MNEIKENGACERAETDRNEADLGYFYGFGHGRYLEALAELRVHGGVNSALTSSIPLAQFWRPANLSRITGVLAPYLPGFNAEKALKFFEFPTDAMSEGRRIGRPSMTDLMLLANGWQIAIEAKFTEYSRMSSETVGAWLQKNPANDALRRLVGRTWLRYIQDAGCSGLVGTQRLYDACGEVGYQFLHRAASACFKTNGDDGQKPALVYQLFFDAADSKSIADRNRFAQELESWAKTLRLRNMKFLILSVPVLNASEVVERFPSADGEIFSRLASESVYRFDFDHITVEDVPLEGEAF